MAEGHAIDGGGGGGDWVCLEVIHKGDRGTADAYGARRRDRALFRGCRGSLRCQERGAGAATMGEALCSVERDPGCRAQSEGDQVCAKGITIMARSAWLFTLRWEMGYWG